MKLSATQVRWFRLRRSGLVEPFARPEQTAERLIGVQAQMPAAAALAFWNRTRGLTAQALEAARVERRSLVRMWGPRNTLHLFHSEDWPFLHAAFSEWDRMFERRLAKAGLAREFGALVRRTEKRLAKGAALTHKDVRSPSLEGKQDKWVVSYVAFMKLVRKGLVCHGADRGSESTFVHREHWLPDLAWDPPEAAEALPELARRYLATYGPAGPRDLAFWYGGNLTQARAWIAAAGEGCREVTVDGRTLVCDAGDLKELREKPPPPGRWPVHLLHRFDPLVLALEDKSPLIDEEHYKKVWRAAAHVEAVLLVGGRIAGTWKYERKSRGLIVRLAPFAPLKPAVAKAVERRANEIAGFLGLELAELKVAKG